MPQVKGYWIYMKYGKERAVKLPEPFTSKQAAQAYLKKTKKFDKKGVKYEIKYVTRTMSKKYKKRK